MHKSLFSKLNFLTAIACLLILGFSLFASPFGHAKEEKGDDPSSSEDKEGVVGGDEVPFAVKRALSTMDKAEQPKFYGAYKAGFTEFKRYNSDWFMLKKGAGNVDSLVNVVFIGNLAKPRHLDNEKTYQSLVSEISVNCQTKRSLIRHLDYKQGQFGTGESIWTVTLRDNVKTEKLIRSFKNKNLQDFVFSKACFPGQ
jgi:hypothetical protein